EDVGLAHQRGELRARDRAEEAYLAVDAERRGEAPVLFLLRSRAREAKTRPAREPAERLQQHVDTLLIVQAAREEEDQRQRRLLCERGEERRIHAVGDHAVRAGRVAAG